MSKYHQRLEEVNSQEKKTVLECIDRPIRPLIVELNRIGLRTKFCCCGFPYRGEEEPKSHARFPFVVLHDPLMNQDELTIRRIEAFFTLARLIAGRGWLLHQYHGNGEWYLSGEKLVEGEEKFYRHDDGERGVHDYETSMIGIQSLVRSLKSVRPISKEFAIHDGNSMYAERTDGEWQIDPKPSVTFTKEAEND